MVSLEEGRFKIPAVPKSIITMENSADVPKIASREKVNIIGELLPNLIYAYQAKLMQDSELVEQSELTEPGRRETLEQISQLRLLGELLSQLSRSSKDFQPTVVKVSTDDKSCTVRIKRKTDAPFGEDEESSQTQISFHTRGLDTESIEETTRAVSLQAKDPHSTLEERNRQLEKEIIQINTVRVFRDPFSGRIKLIPQAGIRMSKVGKDDVRIFGVKYVGSQPHLFDLGEKMPFGMTEFSLFQSYIKRAAGYNNKKHR